MVARMTRQARPLVTALSFTVATMMSRGPLHAQQIPIRQGLGLLYTHRNFDQQTDAQLLVQVLEVGPEEVRMLSPWVSGRTGTAMEERVSRREMAGARTIAFGRVSPTDTTDVRPRTIAMASQRLMRELRAGGPVRARVPLIMGPGFTVILDGTMQLASKEPDLLDLLVENTPRKLRTLHARGQFENVVHGFRMDSDWWFLDDTTAAWMVKTSAVNQKGESFKMVLAAAGDDAGMREALDRSLATSCRAAVYGFYFATNSATPEPESRPMFRTVAEVLAKHPDWTLTVEGHTDSIGNAAANKQLAERRAASVVKELTTQHGVASSRLVPAGFGASRPVAPNATLEGRARNRRVELVRPCDRRD